MVGLRFRIDTNWSVSGFETVVFQVIEKRSPAHPRRSNASCEHEQGGGGLDKEGGRDGEREGTDVAEADDSGEWRRRMKEANEGSE